jgi:hypothetical protein
MDLSKLSNEDLEAIANNDLSKVSDKGLNYIVQQDKFEKELAATKSDTGFTGAFKAGKERLKGDVAALAGRTGIMDTEAAEQYKAEKERLAEKMFTPTQESFAQAPFTKFKELLGGSIPYAAAPLVAGVGAAALPVSAPVAAGIGLTGAGLASLGQFTGSNLSRQMQEDPNLRLSETSLSKATAAAAPQAALDIVSFRMMPGIGKIFGAAGKEITPEIAQKIAEQGILKTTGAYGAGALKTAGIEGTTEAGQQFLERLQAGLDLTDQQARDEYFDSFIGGAVLGGTLGVPGTYLERGRTIKEGARLEEEAKRQEIIDRQKAQRDAYLAQQEQLQQTSQNLGVPSTLALPAPEQKIELIDDVVDPLMDPLGRFKSTDLSPKEVAEVNRRRQAMGKPRIGRTFSIEDLADVFKPEESTAAEGVLGRLIAARTNFTGEDIPAQAIALAAEQRGLDTRTQGFRDFLTRTTGSDSLEAMSAPQRFAVTEAIRNLKAGEEAAILEAGLSNAKHYTPDQYNDTLKGLAKEFKEMGNQENGKTSTLNLIGKYSGLTQAKDRQRILDEAVKNGDLERSVKVSSTGNTIETFKPATAITPLPGGMDIRKETFKQGEAPESYNVRAGSRVISSVQTAEEAQKNAAAYEQSRQAKVVNIEKTIKKLESEMAKRDAELVNDQALGNDQTNAFFIKSANYYGQNQVTQQTIKDLREEQQTFSEPVRVEPVGVKPIAKDSFTFYEKDKPQVKFDSEEAAEKYGISRLDDATLQQIIDSAPAQKQTGRVKRYADLAQKELNDRQSIEGERGIAITTEKGLKGSKERLEKLGIYSKEVQDNLEALRQTLLPALKRFGLERVALRVLNSIEDGTADGYYVKQVMAIALDSKNPMGTLRHESIHALKELGAFTAQEWKVLENKAKSEWVQKYIKNTNLYDAYKARYMEENGNLVGFEPYILEEAIAEAFKNFKVGNLPAGMIGNIWARLNKMFEALRNSFNKLGFQTTDDIFTSIEEGRKQPTKAVASAETKFSFKSPEANKAKDQIINGAKEIAAMDVDERENTSPYEIKQGINAYQWYEANKEVPKPSDKLKKLNWKTSDTLEQSYEWLANVDGTIFALNKREDPDYDPYGTKDDSFEEEEGAVTQGKWNYAYENLLDVLVEDQMRRNGVDKDNRPKIEEKQTWHFDRKELFKDMRNSLVSEEAAPKFALRETEQFSKDAVETNNWKATPTARRMAEDYAVENGITPYVSEGQISIPVEPVKYSIKPPSDDPAQNDPTTGLPLNKNGSVTLYYPTTADEARRINNEKKVAPSNPNMSAIYLTNESSGWKSLGRMGDEYQVTDGSVVRVEIDPSLLQVAEEYEDGRKEFYVPIKEGEYFNKKMRMWAMYAERSKPIPLATKYNELGTAFERSLNAFKQLSEAQKRTRMKEVKDLLKREHNIGKLLGENGKLEKTRVGDYGITYDDKSVASLGLGLASAQKLNDKTSTCPVSAICEGLCLGDTSGNNMMYGGMASGELAKSLEKTSFRAGPRLSQYLKTEAMMVHPDEFVLLLDKEIKAFKRWADKNEYLPAIRLNVTSDIPPKYLKPIIDANPEVIFYDYTKLDSSPVADNHHLTYSSTGVSQTVGNDKVVNKEQNWDRMKRLLDKGSNVAMAFTSKTDMPSVVVDEASGKEYQVWNGDNYDARFLDPKRDDGVGMIVGLTNKAATLKAPTAAKETNGFFIDYDKARDGDRVVIQDQSKFAGSKIIPITKIAVEPTVKEETKKFAIRAPQTEEFKQWFGDSKVVDENGNPMVVYHATKNNFFAFNPKKLTKNTKHPTAKLGFFAAVNPESTDDFITVPYGIGKGTYEAGANVIPLYASIKNPVTIPSGQFVLQSMALQNMKKKDSDKFINDFIQSLRDEGHDGILITADKTGRGLAGGKEFSSDNWVALDPNQFKSAFNEKPTESADMRFSLRAPDTPEFKQFFKGSKVVDEDGKPLPVYHATTNFDGNEFKPMPKKNRSGNPDGYYFTYDIEDANAYAGVKEGAEIIPTFLSIKNPYPYGQKTVHNQAMIDQFEKEMSKAFDLGRLGESWYQEKLDVFKQGRFPNISFPTDAMTRVIQAGGYDGMKDGRDFVAFEPNQIKSAFNQKPTESADIRYSLKGQVDPRIAERIGATTTKRQEAGFVERLIDAISPTAMTKFRQAFINKYDSIEKLSRLRGEKMGADQLLAENSAIAAALQSDRAAGIAASSFRDGIPVLDKGYTYVTDKDSNGVDVKGLIPVLEPLMKYNDPYIFQMFQYYAGTRRGRRLDAEGREKTFTKEDIEAGKQLEAQFPEFATVFDEYQKYNQGLVKYMMDTGVISAQEAKAWTENWDYIPFYRQLDGEATAGPKVFSPIAGVAKPKKLKGSEAPLDDFMETVVRNARAAIEAGLKNEAARRVIRDVVDFGLGERLPSAQSGSDVVSVKENGMTVYYRVADPLMVESLKGLNLPQLPFMDFLSAPADLLRNFVTKDPGFIIANLGRDSMQAWITSGTNMMPIVDTFKQFGKTLANYSPEAYALAKAGLTGYDFAGDVKSTAQQVEKELRKRTGTRTKKEQALLPLTAFWDMLEKGSHASDMATRAEVYKRTLERTGSEAEAFYQAMEVLNFSRKGNSALIRILSATIPFLNARIQGLDVLYRTGFGKAAMENKETIQKAFIFRSMILLGTSVMYWAMVSDDEDYKRLSKEERDNNWIIPAIQVGDKPFRFPIPFELGVLFKVLPERALEYSFGTDTGKDLRESLLRNAMSTLSFNPIPQAVLPLVENATNHSFFTGEPVIGRGVEGLAPQYQYNGGTSELSKKLGKELEYSPQKIENLIRGYTGTLGTYAMMMIDAALTSEGDPVKATKRMEQYPVIKRFFAGDSGTISAYYDLKEEVDTVVQTVNNLQRTGNAEELKTYLEQNKNVYALKNYVSILDKSLKQYNQAGKMINESKTMTADEKREALDKIKEAQLQLTEKVRILRKNREQIE